MDMMSNFRPESHVAQQSRRHKLRDHHHIEDYGTTNNLEELAINQRVNTSDFMQLRNCQYGNISYDPSVFTPVVLEPSPESTTMQLSRRVQQGDDSAYISSAKGSRVMQNYNSWGKINSAQVSDWNMADYGSDSSGIGRDTEQLIVGVGLGCDRKVINNSTMSSLDDQRQGYFGEDVNYGSPSMYQNTLQDVVSSATRGKKDPNMLYSGQQSVKETRRSDVGGELVPPRPSSNQWMDRSNKAMETKISAGGGEDLRRLHCSSQALSLSLSVPSYKKWNDHRNTSDGFGNVPTPKCNKQMVPPNSSQDLVKSSKFNHRGVGPLGPFTGYATILTGSKFLRPAEQLLEDFCNVSCPEAIRSSRVSSKFSFDDGFSIESVVGGSGGDSAGSSSASFSSNDKKAKLLYMQYEVSRRYKRFHQQMQLVVSSFESVAGLSSAAPFFTLALDKIFKHFKALKNSISDQIKNLRKTIGEDSSSPSCMSNLKFIDPAMRKHLVFGSSVPMFESHSQVWRPQRGLPERAVAVLRAWLFDHFLHPYPTDTEKHMLANQTGLARNQVSNWFINARVRVWKPMIEEIHTLEGKGLAKSSDTNVGKTDNGAHPADDADDRQDMNMENGCPGVTASTSAGNRLNGDFWNLGKRPCPDYRTPGTNMDGPLIGFSPYHRNGIGMEGIGAVTTLTLGLRQSVEAAQQQELHHFGGQMIHDFVG